MWMPPLAPLADKPDDWSVEYEALDQSCKPQGPMGAACKQ